MKIAIVSKTDAAGGGASRVAADLAALLNTVEGVEAHHWVGYARGAWRPHMRRLHGGWGARQLHKAALLFSRAVGLPDFFTPELALHRLKGADYDLFHFHDISTAVSPLSLDRLGRRKPLVWTFHDCSAFTGGCLYPMGCTRYRERCGDCPRLSEWPMFTWADFTGAIQGYKRRLAAAGRFRAIAPSHWMAAEAVRSGMFVQPPQVIPYCVDSQRFRPADKQQVRCALGLPTEQRYVLLTAWSLEDERKGVRFAVEALRRLPDPPAVIAVGQRGESLAPILEGMTVHATGHLNDDALLAQYYAAADLLLFPSLADNLPNTILETMAAGTPAVAFASGGVPDMVEHDVTGWLAEPGDVDGLVAGLSTGLGEPERRSRWAVHGRESALARFGCQRFLDAHLEFYRNLLSAGTDGPR